MTDEPEPPFTTGRDHDHGAEQAVLHAFDDPSPENQHAAELAVANLQRRYDHVLRRIDGDGELPPYPVHRHNAADTPEDCLHAVLHELAGAKLDDRAETLAHGLTAAHALAEQAREARARTEAKRNEPEPPRWRSACWSILEAKPAADALLEEVYRRLSIPTPALRGGPVTAENYLYAVMMSLNHNLYVTISRVDSDQWFGIAGEKWDRVTDEEELFWVQCDRPEYGLAHIRKHYADAAGLSVEE